MYLTDSREGAYAQGGNGVTGKVRPLMVVFFVGVKNFCQIERQYRQSKATRIQKE